MRWKYCIHHEWPEERTTWAEAFVRPDDPAYTGQSLWVTIDCIGEFPAGTRSASSEEHETLRNWLGDRPYRVAENGEQGDTDLLVNATDFTQAQFVDWTKVWLNDKRLAATELISAPMKEFEGTHSHADLLAHLIKQDPEY